MDAKIVAKCRNSEPAFSGHHQVHSDDRTGNVKRIKRNSKVRIAPSHFRGEPKSDYIEASAELETNPETVEKYRSRIYGKYSLMGSLTTFIQLFSGSQAKDILVLIRL